MNLWLLAVVLVGGTFISALTVWLSIGLAHRIGAHDHPDGGRKTQERPIPKLGGLAVAVAFAAVAIVGLLGLSGPGTLTLALALLSPALGGALVGYLDDLKHLPPLLRLSLQGLLGFLAWALGTRVIVSGNEIFDLVLTIGFFMIVVNGINLLDNSDGLAAGTVMVSSLGASAIALLYGQELVPLLGFALVGICLGYLWHNWHPARVYLGDSGAYFLGFMLATLVIRLTPSTASAAAGVAIALLLVALPILDTSYVVIIRLRAGMHPFTAGRDHLAHVLQDRGRSIQASVLLLQGLLAVSTILAVGIAALQLI